MFWQESFDSGSIPMDSGSNKGGSSKGSSSSDSDNKREREQNKMFHTATSTSSSTTTSTSTSSNGYMKRPIVQPWKCWGGLGPSSAARAATAATHNATEYMINQFEAYYTNMSSSSSSSSSSKGDASDTTASSTATAPGTDSNRVLMSLYRANIQHLIRTHSFPIVNTACDYLDFNSDMYELNTDEDTIGVALERAVGTIWREVGRARDMAQVRVEGSTAIAAIKGIHDMKAKRVLEKDYSCVDDIHPNANPTPDPKMEKQEDRGSKEAEVLDLEAHELLMSIEDRIDRIEATHGRRLSSSSSSGGSSSLSGSSHTSTVDIDIDILKLYIKDTLLSYVFYGGEGAMWTEAVDYTNFECRTWPRIGIIANKNWNSMSNRPSGTTASSGSSGTATGASGTTTGASTDTQPLNFLSKSFVRAPAEGRGTGTGTGTVLPVHVSMVGSFITGNNGVGSDGRFSGNIEGKSFEEYMYSLGYIVSTDSSSGTTTTTSSSGSTSGTSGFDSLGQYRYEVSKLMLKAYTRYRYYLVEHLGIHAARITLHTTTVDVSDLEGLGTTTTTTTPGTTTTGTANNKNKANTQTGALAGIDGNSPYIRVDGPWRVFSKGPTSHPVLNSEYDLLRYVGMGGESWLGIGGLLCMGVVCMVYICICICGMVYI